MPAVTAAAFPAAGAILTAAEYNKLPRGVVFYNKITANQTSISTIVDLTNFSATWTATTTRLYRTSLYVPEVKQETSSGTGVFRITDSSNNNIVFSDQTIAANGFYTILAQTIETGLSGSITRKGRASTDAGTLSLLMSATSPGFILVEDLGAA